jgi:Uncharacterized conserved protein (some members contain a von Willebrand factor type A (vWA) domain)
MRGRISNRGIKRYIWRRVPQNRGEHVPGRLYALDIGVIILSLVTHLTLLFVGGILLLALLILIDIWATSALHEVHFKAQLSEERVLFGEEATLTISIENAKVLPLPVLNFNMLVPRALPIKDQPVRKTLFTNTIELEGMFNMRWYERVTRKYTIQCLNRGVYTFGPTKLHSGDIFGFIDKDQSLPTKLHLLVYPLTLPLSSFSLPAQHPFGDQRAPRRLIEDPSRVVGLRDYIYGDNLRRIDWKATARTQQMQSKIYDTTTTYTLAIFLNSSMIMDNYYGIHPDLQELAISAAASVSHWAIDAGYAVGLYANTAIRLADEDQSVTMSDAMSAGNKDTQGSQQSNLSAMIAQQMERHRVHLSPSSSGEQYQRILDNLARLQTQGLTPLEEVLFAERHRLPAGSTIVIITNSVNERLTEQLVHLRRNGYAVTILFVGDNAIPQRIAGIKVYPLGGEQTWEKLYTAACKHQQQEILASATPVPALQL